MSLNPWFIESASSGQAFEICCAFKSPRVLLRTYVSKHDVCKAVKHRGVHNVHLELRKYLSHHLCNAMIYVNMKPWQARTAMIAKYSRAKKLCLRDADKF